MALLAAIAGGCAGTDGPPCESGRYAYCFETFPIANRASTAENPETTVRFLLETEELEALVFLDVPESFDAGSLDVVFGGDEDDAAVQMSIGEDTFWGDSGRIVIEVHDGERIAGFGEDIVLDESLRDPEDGDRHAYIARLDFDRDIEHTGD